MSKINATYSSGYYIAPDVDFRKLEEAQRQEQRGKRKKSGADSADDGGDGNVKRQTFAIPFDLICQHCNRRIARGSHVYTNRRATEQRYLDTIRVWELEILCRFCQGKYYLRTDPETPKETGGYICGEGCKRVEGDFFALNKQNQAAREEWEKAKADAELDPLAALEKENEAARLLEERNRQIEEEVEQQAGHNDSDLLRMLRNRPRHNAGLKDRLADQDSDDVSDGDGAETPAPPLKKKTSSGLPPPPPSSNQFDSDKDGTGEPAEVELSDEEDADERSYREFAEDMERRWRALERQQRAQQRKEQESAYAKPTVQEDEVDRVLARYGGGGGGGGVHQTKPSNADSGNLSASSSSPLPLAGTSATGSATEALMSSLVSAVAADLAAPPTPLHRNKFLVADDVDDDGADALPSRPPQQQQQQQQQHQRGLVQTGKPSPSALSTSVQKPTGVMAPQLSRPLPGSSALLRNLVDSDSDDDN